MKIKAKGDFILMLLGYLLVTVFPWDRVFVKAGLSTEWIYIALIIMQFFFMVGLLLFVTTISKARIKKKSINLIAGLLLLPLFLICGSNFFYLIFKPADYHPSFNVYFWLNLILSILTVLNEEIIFRGVLLGSLTRGRGIRRVMFCSIFFAIFHFAQFLSGGFLLVDLLNAIYAFIISVVVCFMFEYAGGFMMSTTFHVAFVGINYCLFSVLVPSTSSIGILFLISLVSFFIVAIYLLFAYVIKLRKIDE